MFKNYKIKKNWLDNKWENRHWDYTVTIYKNFYSNNKVDNIFIFKNYFSNEVFVKTIVIKHNKYVLLNLP